MFVFCQHVYLSQFLNTSTAIFCQIKSCAYLSTISFRIKKKHVLCDQRPTNTAKIMDFFFGFFKIEYHTVIGFITTNNVFVAKHAYFDHFLSINRNFSDDVTIFSIIFLLNNDVILCKFDVIRIFYFHSKNCFVNKHVYIQRFFANQPQL